jgi:hypothetical protein
MQLTVFPALNEDISSGWVWVPSLMEGSRLSVKITNLANERSIYCEVLQIDKNFIARYNQPPRNDIDKPDQSIVMCQWYRHKLGIQSGECVDLKISLIEFCPYGYIRGCLDHPQLINRVAVWLGLLGVFLALPSLFRDFFNLFAFLKACL